MLSVLRLIVLKSVIQKRQDISQKMTDKKYVKRFFHCMAMHIL